VRTETVSPYKYITTWESWTIDGKEEEPKEGEAVQKKGEEIRAGY
jgi:hypothetical protein